MVVSIENLPHAAPTNRVPINPGTYLFKNRNTLFYVYRFLGATGMGGGGGWG